MGCPDEFTETQCGRLSYRIRLGTAAAGFVDHLKFGHLAIWGHLATERSWIFVTSWLGDFVAW
jgi:hypothetical protein